MKEGDIVVCTSVSDFSGEHLTVGKRYKVIYVDFRNQIAVESDNGRSRMFFDKDQFNDVKYLREEKINKILNI
jgi:hypothetical protein